MINQKDRDILRALATDVAEIAALPIQAEIVELWKRINALKPVRPMVMLDQLPWGELEAKCDYLVLQCENKDLHWVEGSLRRTIFKWRNFSGDMVVRPYFEITKAIRNRNEVNFVDESIKTFDARNDVVSHEYHDTLPDEESLEKLLLPDLYHDEQATKATHDMLHDIFGDILPIRIGGVATMFIPWDEISKYRSVTAVLYDMLDRPEFVHKTVRKFADMAFEQKRQLIELGALTAAPDLVHCSGAHCYDLPSGNYNEEKPTPADTWVAGMAQMFSAVSPDMHNEFEIEYALPYYADFGHVYYGCCEPLDRKIEIIKRIKNVRKISMSPWADVDNAARQMGDAYVVSNKPNPAFLSGSTFDIDLVKNDIKKTIEACNKYGTPVEFILKDVSTCMYEPQRIIDWNNAVMDIVRKCES